MHQPREISSSLTLKARRSQAGITPIIWNIQGWGLVLITFLSFFPLLFKLQEYIFVTLLVVSIGVCWPDREKLWIHTPIDRPLLLFLGWVLLTAPFANDFIYSLNEWLKLLAQVLVFYWTVLVLRVNSQIDRFERFGEGKIETKYVNKTVIRRILAGVICGTLVLCLYSLIDFVVRGGTWKDRLIRAASPYSDYNVLSTSLVIAIPLLVVAVMVFRESWQRMVSCSTVGVALLAQIFSYTRAGWLSHVVQGISLGFLTGRRKLIMGALAGSMIISLGLLAVSQTGYQRGTVDPWTLNARLAVWKLGVHEMIRHPIFGLGYGNYTYTPIVKGLPNGDGPMGLHNTFLVVGVGSGLPALALLIWVLVKAVRSLVEQAMKVGDQETHALLIGISIMIIGFSVRNFFDYMFTGSMSYLFWILVATGLCMDHVDDRLDKKPKMPYA